MAYTLGVIGGSGIYDIPGLSDVATIPVDTPYGAPSDNVVRGRLGETTLLFIPRHGKGHRHNPTEVPYRANICALKKLGATHLVSLSAVGSMKEEIVPGHVAIIDQYIDLTKHRASTFFDQGVVAHVMFADPVCPKMAAAATAASRAAGATVHEGGTYVCMEGPQFSTRAESLLYRSWGVSVIGMTAMPEAKLAREAQLPYCTVAFATDYDCWHGAHDDVSVDAVVAVLKKNSALAKNIVAELPKHLFAPGESPAATALENAVITHDDVPAATKDRLSWLLKL